MRFIFIPFFLFGCSNRNDITTQLHNEKKLTEDSIKEAANNESYYMQLAKDEMRASHDSLKWKPLVDSSTYFYGQGRALKDKLKAIDFSLDSLSRIK